MNRVSNGNLTLQGVLYEYGDLIPAGLKIDTYIENIMLSQGQIVLANDERAVIMAAEGAKRKESAAIVLKQRELEKFEHEYKIAKKRVDELEHDWVDASEKFEKAKASLEAEKGKQGLLKENTPQISSKIEVSFVEPISFQDEITPTAGIVEPPMVPALEPKKESEPVKSIFKGRKPRAK